MIGIIKPLQIGVLSR